MASHTAIEAISRLYLSLSFYLSLIYTFLCISHLASGTMSYFALLCSGIAKLDKLAPPILELPGSRGLPLVLVDLLSTILSVYLLINLFITNMIILYSNNANYAHILK